MLDKISIYMSGICGSGMRPLALLASKMGYKVYGSDKVLEDQNHNFHQLFRVYSINASSKPDLEILEKCNYYVFSSAIMDDHIEKKRAKELAINNKIQMFHRMDLLNYLLKDHEIQLVVAGTHGKTSTSSMIGWMLQNLCLNPTIIVGGTPKYLPHSFRYGNGTIACYESDESDGSFLKSNAQYRIVLNIDKDHLNYYGTFEQLVKAFYDFSINDRVCIINNDDLELVKFPYLKKKFYIGYGSTLPSHDLYKYFFLGELKNNILYFQLYKDGSMIYSSKNEGIHFKFPGSHFLWNGLGGIALVFSLLLDYPILSIRSLGNEILSSFSLNSLIRVLNRFTGVERRIDYIGTLNNIDIYDDYGHHPNEILNVLQSLKEIYNKVAIVFQPHRYTRTKELSREFAKVLELADDIYLLPLYSAGEEPIAGVTSELIGRFIRKNVHYIDNHKFDELFYHDYNCIVFMGAGDISNQIRQYLIHKSLIKL